MQLKIITLLFFSISLSCGTEDSQYFEAINPGESYVSLRINRKNFYEEPNVFKGKIKLGKSYIRLSLRDSNGSNIQLELTHEDILQNIEKPIAISSNYQKGYTHYGTFLVGKKSMNSMEGYMLSRASFHWKNFNSHNATLECQGFLVQPGKAIIDDNEIPFSGRIFFKEPFILKQEN